MFQEPIEAAAGSYNSLTHQVAYCKMQGKQADEGTSRHDSSNSFGMVGWSATLSSHASLILLFIFTHCHMSRGFIVASLSTLSYR